MEEASCSLGRPATVLLCDVHFAFQGPFQFAAFRRCPYSPKEPLQRPLYVVVRAGPAAWPAAALPLQVDT